MSFFRRRSEKNKSSESSQTAGLSRSSSLKNERTVNSVLPSPKLWTNNNDPDTGVSLRNGSVGGQQRPHTLLFSTGDLGAKPVLTPDTLESPARTTSRLSKTLQEIIRDKDGLSCFIEFMKSERAEHLIQFWCDAESFQAASLMRLRSHALQSVSKSAILKRRCKSESVSDDSDMAASRCHSGDSENYSKKSSNCDYLDGLITKKPDINSPTLSTEDIKSPTDNRNFRTNLNSPSHLAHVTTETHMESATSPAFTPQPHQSAISSSLSPNQNDVPREAKYVFLDKASDEGLDNKGGRTDQCDIPTDTSHDKSAIPVKHSELSEECSISSQNEASSKSFNDENGDKDKTSAQCQQDTNESEDLATKLRKSIERDAVTIFSNYIAKDAPKPIGVGDGLRADAISKMCREDGQMDPSCFAGCQEFILMKMQSQFFQSFRDSAFHNKHQINVLTSTTVYLPDILLAENALCYFLEYMEQEGASDLMQLWLAVDNFQQQLTLAKDGYDWEQAQNDAMVIYDKYFSLQATNPMGFDDKLRFLIEENICREGGPMPDCFSEAKVIVLKTLDKMFFNNYLQSQVYYRYLSDLLSTVQMAEDMHHKPKGHRRSGSDASSEHSVSSYQSSSDIGATKPRNTLLAVDTRKGKKGAASSSTTTATVPSATIEGDFSMTMDMFNPDDLWKRTSPGGMTLGSVDGLGQFVSNFESDGTDKRKGGGGFLKRWKDKEKEQEEVALRIAQMIINDVNSMTQSTESLGSVLEEDEAEDKTRSTQGR